MKRPSRRLFTELLVVSLAALVWSCAPVPPARVAKEKPVPISELSLEQKIAQMFMVRYSGNYVHESSYAYQQAKRLVQRYGIGGIILFYGSIPGTIENLNDLQSLSRIPLMVAADYERGVGQQLDGGTLFPTNMALAATGQPELANSQGMVTAREASSLGVHVVLAPVMDVNSNPDNPIINFRSFGDSPEVVSRFGVEFIKGIQQNGLFATAKHFPGHGDASADSHTLPPVISASRAEIEETDLAPFKAAIDAGVKVIMVGHLVVPSLDASSLPASVSPELNGRLLRNVMGDEGFFMNDAMEIGGITKSFWAGEAAIRAIEAGSDIVLLSMDVERAMDAVAWAVRSGRLPEKRVDESVRRIMTAKRKLGLWENRAASLSKARSLVGSRDFRSVASEIARKSITLVKDEAGLIPIPVGSAESLTHILLSTDEGLMSMSEPFRSAVSRIHGNVRTKFIYEPLTDLSIQELV
ncbi:MAG: glycoside hydrolase family 3 protein, partial [Fidelibacterota bacterium]